jgi:hypothetical protein
MNWLDEPNGVRYATVELSGDQVGSAASAATFRRQEPPTTPMSPPVGPSE